MTQAKKATPASKVRRGNRAQRATLAPKVYKEKSVLKAQRVIQEPKDHKAKKETPASKVRRANKAQRATQGLKAHKV